MMNSFRITLLFLLGIVFGYILSLILSSSIHHISLGLRLGASLLVAAPIIAILVSICVPLWKEYIVNSSKLSVEINSIERRLAETIRIDLRDHEVFRSVEFNELNSPVLPSKYYRRGAIPQAALPGTVFGPSMSPVIRSNVNSFEVNNSLLGSIEELDYFFKKLKKKNDDFPHIINEVEKMLVYMKQSCTPQEFSRTKFLDYVSFNYPAAMPFVSTAMVRPVPTQRSQEAKEEESKKREKNYDEILKALENEKSSLQDQQRKFQPPLFNIQDAKEAVEKIKKELNANCSKFVIAVSLLNSGRLNTAVKLPAILRIYIGKGTYVNLELTMKEMESNSEVSANSTKIVYFESKEISQLPEDDRNMVNEYWKNNVYCALFLEDVRGKIYGSNPMVFASGVYQKIIYDRLSSYAANYNPLSDLR